MSLKQILPEDVVGQVLQDPRDMVKAGLLESQFPDGVRFTRRQNVCNPTPHFATAGNRD